MFYVVKPIKGVIRFSMGEMDKMAVSGSVSEVGWSEAHPHRNSPKQRDVSNRSIGLFRFQLR